MGPCRTCGGTDRNAGGKCRPCMKRSGIKCRASKKARGECHDCAQLAEVGQAYCVTCLVIKNSRNHDSRDDKKLRGECTQCCGLAITGKTLCTECLKRSCARTMKFQLSQKASGKCTSCANLAMPDRALCDKHLKIHNARTVERQKNDPLTKLSNGLRARFRMALNGKAKRGSAVRNLGMTMDEFYYGYFPTKFFSNPRTGEAMTWENYGRKGWHIDHIRPLSSFDLEDPAQLLIALHYTNLQPLWAEENLKKGSRVT